MATGKWRMEVWHNGTGVQKNVTIPITVTCQGKTMNVNASSQKQIIHTDIETNLGSTICGYFYPCNISGTYSIVNNAAYSGMGPTTQVDEYQADKVDDDDFIMDSEYASRYELMYTFRYGTIFDMSYFITDGDTIEANTERESGLSNLEWFNRCSTSNYHKVNYFEVGCARSFYLDTSGGRPFLWFPSETDLHGEKIDGVIVKILDENKVDITSKFDMFIFKKWTTNIGWYLANAGNIYILKDGITLPSGRYRILTEEFSGHTFYKNDYDYIEDPCPSECWGDCGCDADVPEIGYNYWVNLTNEGVYPWYTWYSDSQCTLEVKSSTPDNYYFGPEEDVWVVIAANGYDTKTVHISHETPTVNVTLENS